MATTPEHSATIQEPTGEQETHIDVNTTDHHTTYRVHINHKLRGRYKLNNPNYEPHSLAHEMYNKDQNIEASKTYPEVRKAPTTPQYQEKPAHMFPNQVSHKA